MNTIWTPHLTVAAVVEHQGRFLIVEERDHGCTVFNQPAGHVEEHETVIEAVIRETLEETGHNFTPSNITGLYRWRSPLNQVTYLRICFSGTCSERGHDFDLDPDIITTHWLNYEQLASRAAELRSPLVLRCIDDYLSGNTLPLDLINELS